MKDLTPRKCPLLMMSEAFPETCRGSECAWWSWHDRSERIGGCGVSNAAMFFPDPSKKPLPDDEAWDTDTEIALDIRRQEDELINNILNGQFDPGKER